MMPQSTAFGNSAQLTRRDLHRVASAFRRKVGSARGAPGSGQLVVSKPWIVTDDEIFNGIASSINSCSQK
jgi:hypothetical protein